MSFGFARPTPLALFRNSRATPRHSLHSLTAHTRHMGPLVSVSSPTPCSRRPSTVWCGSALFYDGHPSLVAACGLSSLGSRLASSSMARSRSPLQYPLHSRSCASLHIRPIGLQLQCRFWHGSMVVTRPTWPRPMPRAARHRGDLSSCAFCTSPVGDFTHCLTCSPAFVDLRIQWCAAAHVAPAEASLWTQHSWTFNPEDLANTRCTVRAHLQFVGQVCARVDSCRRGRADL